MFSGSSPRACMRRGAWSSLSIRTLQLPRVVRSPGFRPSRPSSARLGLLSRSRAPRCAACTITQLSVSEDRSLVLRMFSGSSPRACMPVAGRGASLSIRTFTSALGRSDRRVLPLADPLSSLVVPSRQGSTRKKLAAASGAILEYVGPVAIMAGNRDERQPCSLPPAAAEAAPRVLSPSPRKGRDDVTELKIPPRSAGRQAETCREPSARSARGRQRFASSPRRRTSASTIATNSRFSERQLKRFKALDLMEDALK